MTTESYFGEGSRRMRRSTTADQIKELILTKGLKPGDPLPTELDLHEILGVSRTSIREAMRTLATLDIVEVRHGHGTFVGRMSLSPMVQALVFRGALSPGDDLQALREVVEIREVLELALADTVVAALQGTENPDLHELVNEMETRAGAGQTFLDADRAFHTAMLSALENQLAGQLVGAFWDVHTAVLPKLKLAFPNDLRQTAKAHGDMLRAAEAGDVEEYRAAVVDHYAPLRRSLSNA